MSDGIRSLNAAMRRLWADHVIWTRQYVVAAVGGYPDADAAAARLLKNQEDIGNAVVPFYGESAGTALTDLLKQHIMSVPRLYGARRTPHVFLLDRERTLRYRGRIADSRDPAKVTRRDLACAVEELLTAREVEVLETEPSGCAIVW
jgi:hypothetical protein